MSDKEIIRYAFLSDYVKESSEEEIINKLIELDDKQKEKNNKIKQLQSVIDKAIEYIKHYEKIRGYYEYVENGYDEYNYEEDLQEELLEILRSKE